MQGFLNIPYISLWDSEVGIASKRVEVLTEGIRYVDIGVLVPNKEIAATMHLGNQSCFHTIGSVQKIRKMGQDNVHLLVHMSYSRFSMHSGHRHDFRSIL